MIKFVIAGITGFILWLLWRNWARSRRAAYIDNFPYARLLDKRLAARHPELSASQRQAVFAGLLDYFQLCRSAGKRMVAMPSQVVDDAWHEFILFTRQYDKFCQSAFGRFLHPTPADWPARARRLIHKSRIACHGYLPWMPRC